MKLFIAIMFLSVSAQARQIVIDIPDRDLKIVENDVVSAEAWIRDAWNGKLAKCKSRLAQQEQVRSASEAKPGTPLLIPADTESLVDKAFARPDYISRKEREEILTKTLKR